MTPSRQKKKLENSRILIIDDHEEMAFCLSRALKNKGFDVHLACDGNEGIAKIDILQPDLIVLDLMMPRRSGFLVLEYVRTEIDRLLPVIMITSCTGRRHREYVEQLGIDDYLTKPFPIPTLLHSVDRVLGIAT